MIRGPIVVKSGEDVLLNATLALAIAKQKFAIILDVLSEEFPVHFDLDITAKSSPSTRTLSAPSSTRTFQELMNEIDALAPVDAFSEMPESDSTSPDPLLDSTELAQ